tara:strand:+ start:679 stop:1806 length:1128 start_codon:yes stop_codon:yes gene_type:complete
MLKRATMEDFKTHEGSTSRASILHWVGSGLNWMLFFPILLFERYTKYTVPRLFAFPLLSAAALLGLYDLLYGFLAYPVYEAIIDFSNQSLINSMVVLTTIKSGELLGTLVPGLQAVGEILQQIGDYLANGVLALAIQSAFLVMVKEGLVLRYLLGFGLILLAVPGFYKFGKRLVFGGLILFFLMPAVVSLEAFVYEQATNSIEAELDSNYKKLKENILLGGWSTIEKGATVVKQSVIEGASVAKDSVIEGASVAKDSVISLADKVSGLISGEAPSEVQAPEEELITSVDSEDIKEEEILESKESEVLEAKENQEGLLTTIGSLLQAMINSLLKLFIITILTCVIAPIVAYFLIFRLLREVFTNDYFEILPTVYSE